MRIENAGVLLDDTDGLVKGRDGVISTVNVAQDRSNVQPQLLRVELGCEVVSQCCLVAGRNLHVVPRCCQVAHDVRALAIKVGCPEATANKVDGDCFGLFVGERQDRSRGLAIDELDAKNLGAREGGRDCDGKIRTLLGIFKFFDCLIAVSVRVVGAQSMYHLLPLDRKLWRPARPVRRGQDLESEPF